MSTEGFKVQGQTQGTQGSTQTFSHDVQLIKELVEGKIIRVCYDGVRYHVWTDVGSKRYFMYYRIRVINGRMRIEDLMQVGCLDEELLVEPPEYPDLSPDFINDARLIKNVIGDKIIRICTNNGFRYSVWTDVGSKRYFMYYQVEVSDDEAKILKKLPDGCSEGDILIEPSDDEINASIQQTQQK
jgi:hypothetical protein